MTNLTPFLTVTATGPEITHLVVLSPALPGSRPDTLPGSTLCGRLTGAEVDVHPAGVQCPRCLLRAPAFMGLPSYQVAV